MITFSLDAFVAALHETVRAVEAQLTREEQEKPPPTPLRVISKKGTDPDLFDVFSLNQIKITQLQLDLPVWAKQALFRDRVTLYTRCRSLWRKPRPYLLRIEMKGENLSRISVSLDGHVFRVEERQ